MQAEQEHIRAMMLVYAEKMYKDEPPRLVEKAIEEAMRYEELREVLVLFFKGKTQAQMATALDIPATTASSRLKRAHELIEQRVKGK